MEAGLLAPLPQLQQRLTDAAPDFLNQLGVTAFKVLANAVKDFVNAFVRVISEIVEKLPVSTSHLPLTL